LHVSAEFIEANLRLLLVLHILHDLSHLFLPKQLSFPLEALYERFCCDKAFGALFEVMERKKKIMFGNYFPSVDANRQKLTIVYFFFVMAVVDYIK